MTGNREKIKAMKILTIEMLRIPDKKSSLVTIFKEQVSGIKSSYFLNKV